MQNSSNSAIVENTKLKEELVHARVEIDNLHAQLRWLLGQRFARKSERFEDGQKLIFNDAEVEAAAAQDDSTVKVPAHTRKKKRPIIPAHIPATTIECDLPPTDRQCGDGHGEMLRDGEEVRSKLDYTPAKFHVHHHVCARYRCPVCDAKRVAPVLGADPLPGTVATPALLTQVAVNKYCDALPLYRQEQIFARAGIAITRTTLATWMIKVAELLKPLIDRLRAEILAGAVVQMDETRVQVLSAPGKAATSVSQMWVMVGGTERRVAVVFNFATTRGRVVPLELLRGYRGYLQADAYGGYDAACTQYELDRIGCLMHVRRYFHTAHDRLKKVGGGVVASEALKRIQAIYRVEAAAKGDPERGVAPMTPDERKDYRSRHLAPLMTEFSEFVTKWLGKLPESSATGQALEYAAKEWTKVERVLEDGRLEIDNGRAERAIRPFAVGRRNWLFCDTVAGAEASATLYSLMESAKANGRNPEAYLRCVLERIGHAPAAAVIESLLPWNTAPPSSS